KRQYRKGDGFMRIQRQARIFAPEELFGFANARLILTISQCFQGNGGVQCANEAIMIVENIPTPTAIGMLMAAQPFGRGFKFGKHRREPCNPSGVVSSAVYVPPPQKAEHITNFGTNLLVLYGCLAQDCQVRPPHCISLRHTEY